MLINSNFYIGDSSISRLYQGDNLVWDSSHPDILLEYIANGPDSDSTSTKNVYFNTGVLANANTKCEMKTAIPTYNGQWFCGGCTNGFIGFEMGVSAYHRPYTRIGGYLENGQNTYTNDIQLDVPYTTTVYHDGTNQITVFDSETATTTSGDVNANRFSSTQTILLFGRGLDGTVYTNVSYSGMKIYYTKFWDNNNLIRFYIPVLHYVNGQYTPCFYDKVNDTYIYNLGTDTPTYKISGDYLLDYLGAPPETEIPTTDNLSIKYDTGVVASNQLQTDIKGRLVWGRENFMFGSATSNQTTPTWQRYGYQTMGGSTDADKMRLRLNFGANTSNATAYISTDASVVSGVNTLSMWYNTERAFYCLNGTTNYTGSPVPDTFSPETIYLLSLHTSTSSNNVTKGTRVYYVLFTAANVPAKTYVPVLHNNQAAFLDLNSGNYIYNIGTDTPYYQFK